MITRDRIIDVARSYCGVRFSHQGRSRHEGVDCLGLLLAVAEEVGLLLQGKAAAAYDYRAYGAKPDTLLLQERLTTLLHPIDLKQVIPADVVLLRIEGRPQHLAMISDYPYSHELGMIHAYAPLRKVVEHRFDCNWQRATHAVYRLPDLE